MNSEFVKLTPTGRSAVLTTEMGTIDFVEVFGTIVKDGAEDLEPTTSVTVVTDTMMVLLPVTLDDLKNLTIVTDVV